MKLESGFALLDVKRGRVGLRKAINKKPVRVVIYGEIKCSWGNEDGESQEFEVLVDKVVVE